MLRPCRPVRAAVLGIVALLASGLAACGGASAPGYQRVFAVAGGGSSNADSGPATSLRLPDEIDAMTVAPDGTLWLAASPYAGRGNQLLAVSVSGQARRIRLSPNSPVPTSLAVTRDGTVYGANADTVIWRLSGSSFVPAYGRPGGTHAGVPAGPFVPDGRRLSGGHLGIVQFVAVDPLGRLVFQEAQDFCAKIRRLDSSGTVTTLAGRTCPHDLAVHQLALGRFPPAGTPGRQLYLHFADTAFTVSPHGTIYILTEQSILALDTTTGQARRVFGTGSDDPDRSPVPDPAASRPNASPVPALKAYFHADRRVVASGAGDAVAALGTQQRENYPRAFTWHVQNLHDTVVAPPAHGAPGVVVIKNGSATTASDVGTLMAFRADQLLVAASRNGGAVIVRIPH